MSTTTRKLAAIMFTDIVGYSHLMEIDEDIAVQILERNHNVHIECISKFNGHLVKEVGDGVLCWFPSSIDALNCAICIQSNLKTEKFQIRIGIHLGDIIIKGDDVFGNTVNIASRVQSLANPGAVFMTGQVIQSIKGISKLQTVYFNQKKLKNIDTPVQIYGLQHNQLAPPTNPFLLGDLTGQKINHYRVIEQLGKGGLGVVYKAHDTRLKRQVALKFLTPITSFDTKTKSILVKEARAAASVKHPNICTIYDIEEMDNGMLFIVMEYIDGKTLGYSILNKPLKVEAIVKLGIQAADALSKVHDSGIIHWDIKPSNLMLDIEGYLKILDFGLAKSRFIQPDFQLETKRSIAYMSPEYIQGDPADQRTDIWSIGIVLYELLTGVLPFGSTHEHELDNSLINLDFKPIKRSISNEKIPMALNAIISDCLEKDIDYRIQHAHDLCGRLKKVKRTLEFEKRFPEKIKKGRDKAKRTIHKSAVIIIVLLCLSFMVWGIRYLVEDHSTPENFSFKTLRPFTELGELSNSPDWSKDGLELTYSSNVAGNMDIWKMSIKGGKAERVTSSEFNETSPEWSPDGKYIAFSSDEKGGGIFIIAPSGGNPTRITSFGAHPSWSPDSKNIAFEWQGGVYITNINSDREIIALVKGTSTNPKPCWTPDDKGIAYWNLQNASIEMVSMDSIPQTIYVVPSGIEISSISFSHDGKRMLLSMGPFGGNKNLYVANLDSKTKEVKNSPFPLNLTSTDDIEASFSPNDSSIAFTSRSIIRHLYQYPLDKRTGGIHPEGIKITNIGTLNYYPSYDKSGSSIIWTSHRSGLGQLFFKDLRGGVTQKLTTDYGNDIREINGCFSQSANDIYYSSTLGGSYKLWKVESVGSPGLKITNTLNPERDCGPVILNGGKSTIFYSNRSGNWGIWNFEFESGSQPVIITDWPGNEMFPVVGNDDKTIAFVTDKNGNPDIWGINIDTMESFPIVEDDSQEGWCEWSKDDKWFYYVSDKSGSNNIWIKSFVDNKVRQGTHFSKMDLGLPKDLMYTRFDVSSNSLILPLEERTGDIYILSF